MSDDLSDLSLDHLRRRRSVKWTAYPDDVLPAFIAEMDFPLAPPVKQALVQAIELDDTGYANPEASCLAEAFAGFADRQFNWKVDPQNVVATADVVGALRALLDLVAKPGDGVILNPPVYHPFFSIIPEAGLEVVNVPLSGTGKLDLEATEQAFTNGAKAMILCSPHNPLGTVPTRPELETLAEQAAAQGAWILADEIHAPLTLSGAEHVPFLDVSDAAREHGICVTSASKAFNVAGLSCGLIVTASDRAADLVATLPHGATHPGHLGVIASETAFRDGDTWLEQVREQLDKNRVLLGDLLAEFIPEVSYKPPEAGYLAWIKAQDLGLGSDPAATLVERAKVAVSSGPDFGIGGNGSFRFNFATSPNIIETAVRAIATIR